MNLPTTLRFAFMAGKARAWRDECMRSARGCSDPHLRRQFIRSARLWNHNAIRNAERAKQWYEADLKAGKPL